MNGDEFNRTVENDKPPEGLTGLCAVCNGIVRGEYVRKDTSYERDLFGGTPHYTWILDCYCCDKCSIVYKRPPSIVSHVLNIYSLIDHDKHVDASDIIFDVIDGGCQMMISRVVMNS